MTRKSVPTRAAALELSSTQGKQSQQASNQNPYANAPAQPANNRQSSDVKSIGRRSTGG